MALLLTDSNVQEDEITAVLRNRLEASRKLMASFVKAAYQAQHKSEKDLLGQLRKVQDEVRILSDIISLLWNVPAEHNASL